MEAVFRSHFWLVVGAFLTACGVCPTDGITRRPFKPSDSILDIINTKHVEKIIAERRRLEQATNSSSTPYSQRNDFGDNWDTVNTSEQEDNSTETPSGADYRNLLKSSKNALVVTKKDYLKEDWCKTEPLIQRIREPGCATYTVINKFCYGQCNSFYIPKGPRRRDGNDERPPPAFKSCSFCKPKKVVWMTVKLRCPGLNPPYRFKRLQKVKQCKCLPVGVN